MAIQISAFSREYVRAEVEATKDGAVYDPTVDLVSFAFLQQRKGNDLTGATWYTGGWETMDGVHYARCLVGPDGGVVALTAGKVYNVFLKITDSPEVPVKLVGQLTVI